MSNNCSSKFRKLNANEIECRAARVTEKGVQILLYKTARADQQILDETVGPMNWEKTYSVMGERLYCTISIWDGEKQAWVSKTDVGTESNTCAEKGAASDAQKRAATAWGIGRELYTAPMIWIPAEKTSIVERNGKYYMNDALKVADIRYGNSGEINYLHIANRKGASVYAYGSHS